MATKLFTSFMVWPKPTGPKCTILAAQHSITGLTLANTSSSAPTMASKVPASASTGVRPKGASMKCMPCVWAVWASCLVDTGLEVEQSITIRPFLSLAKMPCGPFIKDSTCGEPVTHKCTISHCIASSFAEVTSVAPKAFSRSTGSRFLLPMMTKA